MVEGKPAQAVRLDSVSQKDVKISVIYDSSSSRAAHLEEPEKSAQAKPQLLLPPAVKLIGVTLTRAAIRQAAKDNNLTEDQALKLALEEGYDVQ